jgi:hypothetical protein
LVGASRLLSNLITVGNGDGNAFRLVDLESSCMKIDHMVDTNSERPRADLIALASNHADIRDALGLHAFPPNLDGVRRHFGEA